MGLLPVTDRSRFKRQKRPFAHEGFCQVRENRLTTQDVVSLRQRRPLTCVPITVTPPKSRSQRDAFREGTPKGGAGAVLVERGDTLRSRAAWASSRPARAGPRGARCTGAGEGPPVCIRCFQEARPEPSRGLKNLGCRGGAPKGERARSMRSKAQ